MTPATWLIVGVAVLGVAYMVGVFLLREFADWSYRREAGRTAADHLPLPEDVAPAESATDELLSAVRERAAVDAAERVMLEEDMCAELESAIAHVEGGWRS